MQFIIIEQMFVEETFVKCRAMILLAENFNEAKDKLKKALKNKATITRDNDEAFMYQMFQLTSKIVGSVENAQAEILS